MLRSKAVVFGVDGVLAGLKPGSIHISMSTISVALAERLASAHQAAGQRFVAAPVFGRPEAAAAGKLFIVAAGEPKTVQACQPLFEALGQHTFVIADEPPKANLVKLSGNFLIAAVIETLGEAFALVSKAGIDRALYLGHPHQHAVRSACIQNLWRNHRRGALHASRVQGEAGLQGHPFGP